MRWVALFALGLFGCGGSAAIDDKPDASDPPVVDAGIPAGFQIPPGKACTEDAGIQISSCSDGFCVAGTCCRGVAGACTSGADCCLGVCEDGSCAGLVSGQACPPQLNYDTQQNGDTTNPGCELATCIAGLCQ
jgi:hypothetical protein